MKSIQIVAPRGNVLHIRVAGEGPAIILLHGFPLDGRMWSQQLESLASHYHVIAPDFRGFGHSTLGQAPFAVCDLADDIEFIRRQLTDNRPIALVGLSMGGYVAFEYWSRYAERISAMVLCNTKPESDSEQAKAGRLKMASDALSQGTWPAICGMLAKLVAPSNVQRDPEIAKRVEGMMRDVPAATVTAAQSAMAARREFTAHLSRILTPTLVITGELDEIAPPAHTRQWSARIPNSNFQVIDSVAHLPPIESPIGFNTVLSRYLEQNL